MSRPKQDFGDVTIELETFLIESGWVRGRETSSLRFFAPPDDLGIQGKYRIALPADPTRPGADALLVQAVNALRDLYGFRVSKMHDRIAIVSGEKSPAIFSVRFMDECTSTGSIPLVAMAAFLSKMEKGLYNEAKFKLESDDSATRTMAQMFTKDCKFLQTREGSFVARVEVPHRVLRDADLFNASIESAHVCSSMFSAIEFINQHVIQGDESFETDSLLQQAISLFNPELLESLAKVVLEPEVETIEFTLGVGSQSRLSSTGKITEDRASRLSEYVDFIRDHFYGEKDLEIAGSIIELRSRDPDGSKNYIRVITEFHGDRTFVSATLDNEQYKRAVDAHQQKRRVTLRGNGIRLKTQIRLTQLTSFDD